jgi:UDP-N-acetyl-D-glucosamine dehydrogenase
MRLLRWRGADLSYHDPFVPELAELGLTSSELPGAADGVDLAVIVTAHPGVDHRDVAARAQLTLDLRGVLRGLDVGAVQL